MDIENSFKYHSVNTDQQARMHTVREMAKELAYFIAVNTSESRETSLAITELESCVFWANASIARNG